MISRRSTLSGGLAASFVAPRIVRADDTPTVVMASYLG